MIYPAKIELCEVGPRDGLQKASRRLTAEEKAGLINCAVDAGFREVEFGAFTEFAEVSSMSDSGEVYGLIKKKDGVVFRALVSSAAAIEKAASFGVGTVKISEFATEHIHGSIDDKISLIGMACKKAAELRVEAYGSISLPFVGPQDGVIPYRNVYRLVKAFADNGVMRVSLGDAAGMAAPNIIHSRLAQLKTDFPETEWVLHVHDTWGFGAANVIAGMEEGITSFDCSFAGLGGCPFIKGGRGNIASEQLVYMLERMDMETGIDLDKAFELAKHVAQLKVGTVNSPYMTSRLAVESN